MYITYCIYYATKRYMSLVFSDSIFDVVDNLFYQETIKETQIKVIANHVNNNNSINTIKTDAYANLRSCRKSHNTNNNNESNCNRNIMEYNTSTVFNPLFRYPNNIKQYQNTC